MVYAHLMEYNYICIAQCVRLEMMYPRSNQRGRCTQRKNIEKRV